MGQVTEIRAEVLLEKVLEEWIEEGTVPTVEQLQEAYQKEIKVHSPLSASRIRNIKLPKRYEESSAELFNSTLEAIEEDEEVLLKALVKLNELSIKLLTEWNGRNKALEAKLSKLRGRIESLILLKQDTAGYTSFIEDGFTSLEYVSSDTTASIDTTIGEVTLGIDSTETEGIYEGTIIDLQRADISFAFIENQNISYSLRTSGIRTPPSDTRADSFTDRNNIRNILDGKNNRWGREARTDKPSKFRTSSKVAKPVIAELKINLPEEKDLSKIILVTSDATAGVPSTIVGQYSQDGYTWNNLPTESYTQSGIGNFSWRFPQTSMKLIKFTISKNSPDSSSSIESIYDFGFSELRVYSEIYEVSESGVDLVSERRIPTLGGSDVLFDRASLEVCDEVPEETSIEYYLRAYDGSSYTDWIKTKPLNYPEGPSPAVVDFATPTELNSEDLSTLFDSSLENGALNILRTDGSGSLSYRFSGPNEVTTNFYMNQNDTFLTDFILLRNRGYSSGKFPTVTQDKKVGETEIGWGLTLDNYYYCSFRVKRPTGLRLDFGPRQVIIDNIPKSGVVNISPGWHSFKTIRSNWVSLYGTSPTTVAQLRLLDPLYPYNHKYVIEGYNYPTNWTGEKVYTGVDEYCQFLGNRIGRHTFRNTGLDLSVYTTDVISGPKTIVLLKFNSSYSNHENERIKLYYTRRFESFTGIQFKAILNTNNREKTPMLSYYRIKTK